MARKTITGEWAATASTSEIVEPTTVKQNAGWTAEKPPYQNFNWAWQIFTNMLQNAEQFGIMQWSTDTTYPQYGRALGTDGNWYKSKAPGNQGNDPVSDTANTYWTGEKNDFEYAAITGTSGVVGTGDLSGVTGLSYDSGSTSASGSATYIMSNFTGASLVPSEIRSIHIEASVRANSITNQKAEVLVSYPDGTTKPLLLTERDAQQGENSTWVTLVAEVPVNKSQPSIALSVDVVGIAGHERAIYTIVGATQRSF